MKFSLLNIDDDAYEFAAALVAAGHELTLAYRPGEWEPQLREIAPTMRFVAEWEEAMVCGADAVIVGTTGDEPRRLEQLQRLVQEGVPTVAVHPQTTSALAYYELDMHRQATNVALVAYEPTRHQPAVALLDVLGPIDEATIEHRTDHRSRAEILQRFARDMGAIRRAVGPCEKVSAVGTLPADGGDGRLGVQITTHGGSLVRWTIGPAVGAARSQWQLSSAGGAAILYPTDDGEWPIEFVRVGVPLEYPIEPGALMKDAVKAIVAALGDPNNTLWREALADLELVEAVERSQRKGRTVELFHEEAGEQGTFKAVMAAGGCLLLLVSIGLAIAATIVGRFRLAIADVWPFALVAVLGLFLTLQLLQFVFAPKREDD